MIIGGEAIFAESLPLADRIELTQVHAAPQGDAFMPSIDPDAWKEIRRDGPHEENGLRFSYVTLERR